MLLFGHIGLTLGATWGVQHVLEAKEHRTGAAAGDTTSEVRVRTSFAHKVLLFLRRLDYRIIIVGSMLPDIIDKPVGAFFFRETFSSGHIYGHTLLFFILTALAGLYLYKSRGITWASALSIGIFAHLTFDQIWHALRTLFWPLFGSSFAKEDVTIIIPPILREPALNAGDLNNWIPDVVRNWLNNPRDYVPEIAGMAVLLFFTYVLIRKKQVLRFLRSGRIGD
ncbi:MAG: zinc dependent phospholipase C family protein [Dehalococcoidales bacterium]|nr:zinc dependent phospholipase C family protein [Dehalococcoidales bacterium]